MTDADTPAVREPHVCPAEVGGHRIAVAARPIQAHLFAGVVSVCVLDDGERCEPPVAIMVPGQWQSEEEARRAAADYAEVMARTGALRLATRVRTLAGG